LITGFIITSNVNVQTSDITIKRNRFDANDIFITMGTGVTNVLVLQNYMSDSRSSNGIALGSNNQNIIISNNFIARLLSSNIISGPGSATAIINNNVLFGVLDVDNSTIQDNILRDGTLSGANNSANSNIANSTQFDGLGSNNQASVDIATVFEGTGSSDGQWQLKAGSPALGNGVGNGDIGMYGGGDPYVLSGIPSIPAIYFFNAPVQGSTTSGLPVQMQVKSRN
jgi:hypothetical protein